MPTPKTPPPIPPARTPGKNLRMMALGIVSALYLANPTAGVFELIPDVIPGVGNVDEALATILLLRVLAYFGIYIGGLGKKNTKKEGPVIDIDPPERR